MIFIEIHKIITRKTVLLMRGFINKNKIRDTMETLTRLLVKSIVYYLIN